MDPQVGGEVQVVGSCDGVVVVNSRTSGRRFSNVAVIVAVLAGAAACGSEEADSTNAGSGATGEASVPTDQIEMSQSDACGDVFFWAVDESGEIAVTVAMEAKGSPDGPTSIPFTLPSGDATVRILRGEDLARNFCTDLPEEGAEPASQHAATAGNGSITLDPVAQGAQCGAISGTLRLDGLVADDGTTFAPIEVRSERLGCYSG